MAIVPFNDPELKGVVGGHVNSEEWNAVTRLPSAAGIGMGQPVSRDGDFNIVAFNGTDYLGVTRYHIEADTETGFPALFNTPVMTMGVMWVAAGDTVAAGDAAGYDATGDRWGVADGVTYIATPGIEFDSSGAAESLVKIRILRQTA